MLVRGFGGKADVFAVVVDGARVLVKDFGGRAFWARQLGRFQVGREAAAYAWLGGIHGVPGFVGRIDAFALAIEWIDGERLAFAEVRPHDGPALVAKLREILTDWPVDRPNNWVTRVNAAETTAELEDLRLSVTRGRPFGNPIWTKRAITRLGLESSIRPRGRPRKDAGGKQ